MDVEEDVGWVPVGCGAIGNFPYGGNDDVGIIHGPHDPVVARIKPLGMDRGPWLWMRRTAASGEHDQKAEQSQSHD
jgi:hypothetical protein